MKSIYSLFVVLEVVALAAASFGCGKSQMQREDAGRPGISVRRTEDQVTSPVLSKEQATLIASEEAKKRGWQNLKVATCDLNGSNWVVRLEYLPPVWGGDARVEIPTNGGILRYIGGR